MKKCKAGLIIVALCAALATGCAGAEKGGQAGSDAADRTEENEAKGDRVDSDVKEKSGLTGGQTPEDGVQVEDGAQTGNEAPEDGDSPGNGAQTEDERQTKNGVQTGNGTPGNGEQTKGGEQTAGEGNSAQKAPGGAASGTDAETDLICPEGMTLAARIAAPEGFSRATAAEGSFAAFLRDYPMKEDGSPVLLYDGREKGNQSAHAAVFALPIENEDLQQCADSVMRMYAEYFWESGQKERIAFHFVNGFYAEYTRWRDGERIQVSGNEVSWVRTADYDDSYENLKKYLRYVFSYASTLSMERESEPVSADEIAVGDVFLKGGSPGHVVMVVDLCADMQGEKAFLLAQGYMPAQEFHVLNNPLHPDDPWYYERELAFPLVTPEYTFGEGSLRRPGY